MSSSSEDNGGGARRDYDAPSSSRQRRSDNRVWPEPFVEALATNVAIDASQTQGRLAAAQVLFNVFQVCSTWRAVSNSDLLWQNLTRRIWHCNNLRHNTWHEEYVYHHRLARNFHARRYLYNTLHLGPADDNNNNESLVCRRLTISDYYLAAGFSDGTVRLFHLPNMLYLSTFRPQNRNRLGHFSPAVSGIILTETQIVFASLDGDIHVAMTDSAIPPRRAHLGDVVNDGALVDFNGCTQWWVGLYAGVPGRAFHVWNGVTEELVFIGGTLTDHEAVRGWHLLTELTELIGRVRLTSRELAVACTSLRFIVFDLRDQVIVLGEEEFPGRLMVGAFDARHEEFVIVDRRGSASVRRVGTLEEVCRFDVRGASQRGVLGCTNGGYALMCVGGLIRAWEIEHGEHLYSLVERIGEATALVADERYLVACSSDNTIHLWDFGVQ
ncbi:Transcriptional regulator STERILE APETALA [Heracleum sosnowskyi]|uniref:Transcriptional regulator STERILE APETALA n=1 Tax=Heracleum sosnowskyi TaxID=360622 RepID=A0AAD8GSH3_9APIA|nr:Transcriptional regulator STERILE APETALA [Heracleum sosnowskyi]